MPGRTIRPVRPASDGRRAGGDLPLPGLTPLQAEVARIMAAVRNKLADMDVRLEDMSDANIIIFVPSTCDSDRRATTSHSTRTSPNAFTLWEDAPPVEGGPVGAGADGVQATPFALYIKSDIPRSEK